MMNFRQIIKGGSMGDKLTTMYEEWMKTVKSPNNYQAFQGGLTASAVSMRQRAIAAANSMSTLIPGDQVTVDKVVNAIVNLIGKLPDIPE